ncbi:ferritin-like domain-containing protein [Streptomyces sp. NPDC001222]|uniref:ferritin-like domain-containing protein n=1 Tax=Streptomyces sp. NPDC001222 TaxID=3364548 RepID=UPI003685F20B
MPADEVTAAITARSVLMEETVHMAVAADMVAALGGSPGASQPPGWGLGGGAEVAYGGSVA